MLKIAICGGSGYTGAELLRILSLHPYTEITAVTSEKSSGTKVTSVFPHLVKCQNLIYEPLNKEELLLKADLFFMALPYQSSQEVVSFFFKHGKKVIDLSSDYRIKNPVIYEKWYKVKHYCKDILKNAIYGLPEIYRQEIKKTTLIANPGCYPTTAILGLYPVLKKYLIKTDNIIIDSKSGVSGAGRKSDLTVSYCEVNNGFKPYNITTHRHTPEIEQELSAIAQKDININFTPHLASMDRGIISTIYAKMEKSITTKEIIHLYKETYINDPFINIMEEDNYPNTKFVRGTNYCYIGLKLNEITNTLIIVSAIDNLVKGASGQAVQNMNIMMDFPEITALHHLALIP